MTKACLLKTSVWDINSHTEVHFYLKGEEVTYTNITFRPETPVDPVEPEEGTDPEVSDPTES